MTDFVKWTPKYVGHKPPYWREEMGWEHWPEPPSRDTHHVQPAWDDCADYSVPREAVYGQANGAKVDLWEAVSEFNLSSVARNLRKYPAEELAKHGITLAPEKDWATELWADLLEARGHEDGAWYVRNGEFGECDKDAIELLRSRMPKEASNA